MGLGRGRGRGDSEGLIITCGSCCFILFVIAAGLVGGSFKIIEPTQYGILFNTLSKELTTNQIYTNGRFFVGLARDFIIYPRGRQNIVFDNGNSGVLNIRSSQGQVSMTASLQYSLNVSQLVPLYRNFGTNYQSRFVSIAQSAINSALSAAFNISDFYSNRAGVIAAMAASLQSGFVANGAILNDVQLGTVTLPQGNEDQIVNKIVSQQQAQTAQNVQQQQRIAAQTAVIVGQVQQYIALYNANQTQLASVITTSANSQARRLQVNAASSAYAVLSQTLNFTNADLLRYLYLKNVRGLPANATVAVGWPVLTGLIPGTN